MGFFSFVLAPKIFSIAFSIVKPFMNENTRKKISIYGQEPEVWKAALLAEIDADQLPVAYGGKMTDPDGNPHCITKVIISNLKLLKF